MSKGSSGHASASNYFSEEVAAIVADLSGKLHQLLQHHEARILGASFSGSTAGVPPDLRKQAAPKHSDNLDQDMLDSDIPSPAPDHAAKLQTSFDEAETHVLPWSPEPANGQSVTQCESRVTTSSSAPSCFLGKMSKPSTGVKPTRSLELRTCWSDITDTMLLDSIKNTETRVNTEAAKFVKSAEPRATRRFYRASYAEMGSAVVHASCLSNLSFGIMHPAGQARVFWNVATFFLICSDILAIPLLSFEIGDTPPWDVFAWVCTLFWTTDMIMSFRTGFYIGVKVEMRQMPIVRQYAKTWLPLDAFIVLFEWTSRLFSSMASAQLVRTTRAIRVVRLVKLLRMAKMKDLVGEFAERLKSNVVYLMMQIFMLTMLLCVGTHFVTCFWYTLGQSSPDGWTSYDLYALRNPEQVADFGVAYWYVSSARWVVSQLNGRTDMDERRNMRERAFTVIGGLLLSLVWHAIFISLITKAMLQLSDLFKKQHERRRIVNDYLSLYTLPSAIERGIKYHAREYKDTDAAKQREAVVLTLLPKQLQSDLLYEVRKPLLTSQPLFRILIGEFMKAGRHICHFVATRVYTLRDEMIFDSESPCSRMLVVDTGSLTYDQRDRTADDDAADARGKDEEQRQSKRFTASRLVSPSAANATLKRFRSSLGSSTRLDQVSQVTSGMLVSEAALWVTWVNKGQLITEESCCMLAIEATRFADALQAYSDAFALAVVYSKKYQQSVSEDQLSSDIEACEVQNFDVLSWAFALKKIHEKEGKGAEEHDLD